MNRRWLIFAALVVAVAQISFLVSMIAGRAMVLRNGQEVILAVEPVDPRDLLRGDYVTLSYNISRLPLSLFSTSDQKAVKYERGGEVTVFVRLKADEDGVFQPVMARFDEKPETIASEGEVDIRGQASRHWSSGAQSLFIRYDIERFYVPEGQGREIENNLRERNFRMKVAVGSDGAAQIKSFYDGEVMLYAEPLY